MGDTAAHQLRALGTRGVLVQMAQRGQILELRCEMPKSCCHKGRGYFEPRSTPSPDLEEHVGGADAAADAPSPWLQRVPPRVG